MVRNGGVTLHPAILQVSEGPGGGPPYSKLGNWTIPSGFYVSLNGVTDSTVSLGRYFCCLIASSPTNFFPWYADNSSLLISFSVMPLLLACKFLFGGLQPWGRDCDTEASQNYILHSFNLTSYVRAFIPSIIFVAPLCTLSNLYIYITCMNDKFDSINCNASTTTWQ